MRDTEAMLTDADYAALADFRFALREFQAFSEARAIEIGLTPQQHQALLALRSASPDAATVGRLAQQLMLKPQSASGLADRLERLGLVQREPATGDRRRTLLGLTDKAHRHLATLSAVHRDQIRRLRPTLEGILASIG